MGTKYVRNITLKKDNKKTYTIKKESLLKKSMVDNT